MNRFTAPILLILAIAGLPPGIADDTADHPHKPIYVRSRPVIERVPLKVITPVDVLVNNVGETFVADAVGEVVFRIDSVGEISVLGTNLKNLSRLAFSSLGTHVLLAEKSSGRVIRMTETGFKEDVLHLPFTPAGLAIDASGNIWTTSGQAGRVFQYDNEQQKNIDVQLSESVTDLTLDPLGNAIVLLKSGKLVTVFVDGSTNSKAGFVPESSNRLIYHPRGFVLALAEGENERPILVRASPDRNTEERFAGVIPGTSAVAFDKRGNLTLANPDLRAITRMTSHFEVSCPACGKPVEMVLSPHAPAEKKKPLRHHF